MNIKILLIFLYLIIGIPRVSGEIIKDPYSDINAQKALVEAIEYIRLYTHKSNIIIEDHTEDIMGYLINCVDDSTYSSLMEYLFLDGYKNDYGDSTIKSDFLTSLCQSSSHPVSKSYKLYISPPYYGFININVLKYCKDNQSEKRWCNYLFFLFRYCEKSGMIFYFEKRELNKEYFE